MNSPNRDQPKESDRRIEITRSNGGWAIRVNDSNPETRHKPLTRSEREIVREEIRKGRAAIAD